MVLSALKRADSTASSTKRKVSSISASEGSDHEAADASPGPDDPSKAPHPPAQEEKDPLATEMSKFDLPEEDDQMERNMPWLKVISKLSNSYNFHCTHQGFCHTNCYRRQMRATKRLMEAARHVSILSNS